MVTQRVQRLENRVLLLDFFYSCSLTFCYPITLKLMWYVEGICGYRLASGLPVAYTYFLFFLLVMNVTTHVSSVSRRYPIPL